MVAVVATGTAAVAEEEMKVVAAEVVEAAVVVEASEPTVQDHSFFSPKPCDYCRKLCNFAGEK